MPLLTYQRFEIVKCGSGLKLQKDLLVEGSVIKAVVALGFYTCLWLRVGDVLCHRAILRIS